MENTNSKQAIIAPGAESGSGYTIAKKFAEGGANLLLVDRTEAKWARAVEQLGGFDAAAKRMLAVVLRKTLQWVNARLTGKSCLTCRSFTAADAYLFAALGRAKLVQLAIVGLAQLQAFMSRAAGRPAVPEAINTVVLLA